MNSNKNLINYISIFCLFILAPVVNSDENISLGSSDIVTVESTFKYDFHRYIPLIVRVKPGDRLYNDSSWAIKIEEVLVDDVAIPKREVFTSIFMDLSSFEVNENQHIYLLPHLNMLLGDGETAHDSEGNYTSFITYEIPEKFDSLVIKYRLKFLHVIDDKTVVDRIDPQLYIMRIRGLRHY